MQFRPRRVSNNAIDTAIGTQGRFTTIDIILYLCSIINATAAETATFLRLFQLCTIPTRMFMHICHRNGNPLV